MGTESIFSNELGVRSSLKVVINRDRHLIY